MDCSGSHRPSVRVSYNSPSSVASPLIEIIFFLNSTQKYIGLIATISTTFSRPLKLWEFLKNIFYLFFFSYKCNNSYFHFIIYFLLLKKGNLRRFLKIIIMIIFFINLTFFYYIFSQKVSPTDTPTFSSTRHSNDLGRFRHRFSHSEK